MSEENWKEKYTEFQMLQQQAVQINEHLEMLNQQLLELDISKNAVSELGETKVGTEILSPLANGIFIRSKLENNQSLVVNVGSNTTVERTTEEVVSLLGQQEVELRKKLVDVEKVMQHIQNKLMSIYQDIQNAE